MKKGVLVFLLFISIGGFGQDFLTELENSMERSEGGVGVKVVYKVHLSPSTVKMFRSSEFDVGEIIEKDGKPILFELTRTQGADKQKVVINLESPSFMEFKIFYVKGNCNYQFDFFY